MAIKYYKLTGYKPFWIYAEGKYPSRHVEDILQSFSLNNRRTLKGLNKLTAEMSNEEHWIPTENYEWKNIWKVTGTGKLEDIADYLKVVIGGKNYYYYLVNKTENIKAVEGDTPYWDAEYEFDEFMTVFWDKIQVLKSYNPTVFVKFGFDSRWDQRYDNNGNAIGYTIDYVNQRWLSNTMGGRNNMMVRQLAYYTTAQDIFSLNFPNLTIPATYSINRYDTGSNAITINGFNTKVATPNSRGRYWYIIAKSSAKQKSSNDELLPSHTDQQTIIIPLFAGEENTILHAINDFDFTTDGDGFLNPAGENEIGIWECDVPYSFFYGLVADNHKFNCKMEYAHQNMGGNSYIDIPFFSIDNNAPIKLKIIDYAAYRNGFYGKFLNMIENIYQWTPETEPAMWNPSYYQEVYNNGEAELTIDAAKFVFNWNNETINQFGVEAYLSLSADLVLAYSFGENTNSQLATLDNTETIIGKGSIKNFVVGSNSANFYTTNAATTCTSIKNRQSEETQAWTDAALNSAKQVLDIAPNNIIQAINPFRYAKKAGMAALNISQIMTDTALEQQRANREFRAGINNIVTAPNQTLADPSVKGVIPNKYGLFETYAKKLHPVDERVIFTDYLHHGYPMDCDMLFNDLLSNRQIMNVINLDTTKYDDNLMSILSENDTGIFNTKFWNKRFLAFLNGESNIYNTTRLVNCTDYWGAQYVSNIETELPVVPVPKEYIGRHIRNFRNEYEARQDFIMGALMEDNPAAPDDPNIWDQVQIRDIGLGGFIIEVKSDATDFYGSIIVNATCYNGYIQDGDVRHYFWNVDFLCNTDYRIGSKLTSLIPDKEWTITCPDGITYSNKTFNCPIVWNDEIESTTVINIPDGFLNACYSFQQDLTIPSYINSVGTHFMYDCSMNFQYIRGGLTPIIICLNYVIPKGNYTITINCNPSKFASSNETLSYPSYYEQLDVGGGYGVGYIPEYQTGTFRTITGTYATQFKNKFPERNLGTIFYLTGQYNVYARKY